MKKIKLRIMQLRIIVKYIFIKLIEKFIKTKKYKNTWLICERGDEARDNGYAFFKYMRSKHPQIDVKYIINKKSPDYLKMQYKDDVIWYQSFNHLIAFIQSKYLISTHIMGFSPEFRSFSKLYKRLSWFDGRGKKIFLQHGIIYNFLPSLVNLDLSLFITSSNIERQFIIKKFGYNGNVVKCTGLARYDNFTGENSDFILLMPTWRSNLFYVSKEEFMRSKYFLKWQEFLDSKELYRILDNNNLYLYFYPHFEIQKFINCFKINNERIILASRNEHDLPELLNRCKMMITDYTSASFDVSFQKKPLIYYQFDYNDFYSNHYKQGYMTMKKEGFGLSVDKISDLLIELKKICKNNFKIEKLYENRIKKFFAHNDKKNCERIYKNILNLEKKIKM